MATEGDILFSDGFETENGRKDWRVHWGNPVGAGTVDSPAAYVHSGMRSMYVESKKGRHQSVGSGEYVLDPAADNVLFVKMHLRLEDGFSMGTSNQLKLFSIRGGAKVEDTYGGAGRKPNGKDKFSATVGLSNQKRLHVYYYHPDQRQGWGDWFNCGFSFFRSAGIEPGKWYCLELMLKNNSPGLKNGELTVWLDGTPVGRVGSLRFRDVDSVKIRRVTVEIYFGGDSVRDTSPKDQRIYIDDFAISTKRVGCLFGDRVSGAGRDRR